MDHRHNGKENHQQGGKGEGLFEGMTQLVFLDHAVERRQQDDDHQADEAYRRQVKCESGDKDCRDHRLHSQSGV